MRFLLYLAVATALAAAVGMVLFPLSLALSLAGAPLEGDPQGTVWKGRIENAAYRGQPLGTVDLTVDPLPLVTGRLAGSFSIDGPPGEGEGHFALRGRELSLSEASGVVRLAALPLVDPLGRQVEGVVRFEVSDLALTQDACRSGDVTMQTDAFAEAVRSFGAEGFELEGSGACEDGTLYLPLEGRGEEGEAALVLMASPRRFVSELTIRPADPSLGSALRQYGFQRTPQGYTLTTRGRI